MKLSLLFHLMFMGSSLSFTIKPPQIKPKHEVTYISTITSPSKTLIQFISSMSLFAFTLIDTNVPYIPSYANAALIQSGYCASGSGDGCDQLNEGNEFIKSLQQKSLENKDRYQKEALAAYNMKNYPDFFASLTPPKYLVMNTDGVTFQVFTEQELSQLKQEGKITVQMPKTMNGKVTDVTQKPIMIFKE